MSFRVHSANSEWKYLALFPARLASVALAENFNVSFFAFISRYRGDLRSKVSIVVSTSLIYSEYFITAYLLVKLE
jgi:hypothetical protein